MVGNDYTISWRRRRYQIPAQKAKPRMRKAAVQIEQRLDGELWLRWNEDVIPLRECLEAELTAAGNPARQAAKAARKTPANNKQAKKKSRWMDGFVLGDPATRRQPAELRCACQAHAASW